jgi:hypothetical protein
MSLTSQAVVAVTHYLLDGSTWAGNRVHEQPLDPIGDLMRPTEEAAQPVICVYVEKARAPITGRLTQGDFTEITLKIIVYISPGKTKLPDDAGYEFELDSNSAGLTLNIVARQVDAVFHRGGSDWLPVWKKLLYQITERVERYLLVEVENGFKIPAIEISYMGNAIPDPDYGAPMTAGWAAFDAALRAAGGEKILLADLFTGLIENPAGLPSYQVLQNNYGLTDAALAATGLGPVPGATDEDGEIVDLEEVDLTSSTIITPEDD